MELEALRVLMKDAGITDQQVLDAFKGRYSAVENIEPQVIQTRLIDKWDAFVNHVKGGSKK